MAVGTAGIAGPAGCKTTGEDSPGERYTEGPTEPGTETTEDSAA